MAIDKIYPTRWPLFEFWLGLWKLKIVASIMSPSIESLTYQYIVLMANWGSKELFRFRLYDSDRRMIAKLDPLIGSNKSVYSKEDLKQIIKVAKEELEKIK